MIRTTTNVDHEALITLATACGLFEPDQTELLAEMLRNPSETDVWFTDDLDGHPVGVAYLAPEKMTHGTWNLYWIAVHPQQQKRGRGKLILQYVENWLRERDQRMLLVETAGVDDFDYVRKFYAANGFQAEAQIRDFYDDGVDKIVFRKLLSH
jgi:ribosomal protein S18 acetylase RimI-like enzyme